MTDKDFGSNRQGDLPTEGHDAAVAAFIDGFRLALEFMAGPRVERPAHITDDQWVMWYGAKRRDDGSFSAPMSVAHLVPNPAHSKPSFLGHARALASQKATTASAVGTERSEVNQNNQVIP